MLNTLSFLGLLVAVLGAVGAYARFTSPTLGIYLILGGIGWMALLFLPSWLSWLKWRQKSGAGLAFLLGFCALGALAVAGYYWYLNPLNDLTTNTAKPPQFTQPVYRIQPQRGRELLDKSAEIDRAYPSEFAGQQNAHYTNLESMQVKAPPIELVAPIETAIKQRFPDWKITISEKTAPHIEAEIENPYLRTIDDFVLEARESKKNPNVSNVDFRIRNRFPYGDLGLSAKRMEEVNLALGPVLQQTEQKWADYQKQYATKAVAPGEIPGAVSDHAAAVPKPAEKAPTSKAAEIPGEGTE